MVIQYIRVWRCLENKSYYPRDCQGQFVEDCFSQLKSPAHLHWRNWELITGATSSNLPLWRRIKTSNIRVNMIALSTTIDFWNLKCATFFVLAQSKPPEASYYIWELRAICSQDYTSWLRAFGGISRTDGS